MSSGHLIERVCVVGAGAIGSLYAAHLARVAEVTVLTRRHDHAKSLARSGLRVSGKADFIAQLRATTDVAELQDIDLAIIATKATQLEDTASVLANHIAGATVMTIQNGLGAEEIVRRHGDWPLVSAITFMAGIRHEDTHVEYELDTETWLGPYAGTTSEAEVRAVERLLIESGLRARAFLDLRPAQWSKLIFNATVNAIAAVTELPHVPQYAARDSRGDLGHVLYALMEEGKRIAAATGVELHEDPWEMNVEAVRRGETLRTRGVYAHVPSMLEDVRARRRTEADFITGALVREASKAGVDSPLHSAMYRLVKAREEVLL